MQFYHMAFIKFIPEYVRFLNSFDKSLYETTTHVRSYI